jgi:hypothetical protein
VVVALGDFYYNKIVEVEVGADHHMRLAVAEKEVIVGMSHHTDSDVLAGRSAEVMPWGG